MIVRRFLLVFIVIVLALFHSAILSMITNERKNLPRSVESSYVLPSPILKIMSLGYHELVADFLFLRAIAFYGSTLERHETPLVKDWEWHWIYNTLKASTDLDVYFYDPYYVANALLPWVGHAKETSELLDKGIRARYWDWQLPFFAGFNYFYFLHDNVKASEYLMEASRRPPSSRVIFTLASRLAYEGNKTNNAIIFVEEILKNTTDESIRREFVTRLKALKMVSFLEEGIIVYRKKYGKQPKNLLDMVQRKVIMEIPKDPYGGEFYLDKDGHVKTTSHLVSTYTGKFH